MKHGGWQDLQTTVDNQLIVISQYIGLDRCFNNSLIHRRLKQTVTGDNKCQFAL